MGKRTYTWRRLAPAQREDLLDWRKRQGLPWHRPPHRASEKIRYHITAACFEHRSHIGHRPERMQSFCRALFDVFQGHGTRIHAWCVLPNHYHALIEAPEILVVLAGLGRMHGRLSFEWNGEERTRGRQVWCGVVERFMRNEAHFWATMNYVHHNPVHHGYVEHWRDWPFSSAQDYLVAIGREEAERIWNEYPVLEYGKGWDETEM